MAQPKPHASIQFLDTEGGCVSGCTAPPRMFVRVHRGSLTTDVCRVACANDKHQMLVLHEAAEQWRKLNASI